MFRFLAAPVACLALAGAAAAQDQAVVAGAMPMPASPAPEVRLPDPGARLDSLALRHPEPEAAQTTASLKSPADLPREALGPAPRAAPRPWCAQERRVGTGAGFCLIN